MRTYIYKWILIFLAEFCLADEVIYKNNNGGLNSKASPISLEDNEASDLRNINLDTDNAIKKRLGYDQLNISTITAQIDGLFNYVMAAGTIYTVCMATNIYKMESLDGTWDDITDTSITADSPARAVTFEDALIMTNDTDIPQVWTGTGTAADSDANSDITLTAAKCVEVFKNRLFFANVTVDGTAYPNRVYWSSIGDKDAWSANDYVTLDVDDGDVIMALKSFAGQLFVFKKFTIYKMQATGDSTTPFTWEETQATDGTIATDSVQIIPGHRVIAYLAQSGISIFDGNISEVISYKIQPTIDALDGANLVLAKSAVYKALNQYWLAVCDGDSGDRIIIWDYFHNAFLVHDGIYACSLMQMTDSTEEERFYFGDFSGYVYRYNTGYDDYPLGVQTAINAYYDTKWYDFGSFIYTFSMPFIRLCYSYTSNPDTLSMSYYYDLSSEIFATETLEQSAPDVAVWDTARWDIDVWPGSGASLYRFDLMDSGTMLKLRFSNNFLTETFTIYGWSIGFQREHISDN